MDFQLERIAQLEIHLRCNKQTFKILLSMKRKQNKTKKKRESNHKQVHIQNIYLL